MIASLTYCLVSLLGISVSLPSMFEEDVLKLGYPCETHTVRTSDGFLLTVFRIQAKNSNLTNEGMLLPGKEVVLLSHGLDESSDVFIVNSEDKALAFILANQGFDVWLMNNRGNAYSRQHTNYLIEDAKLWDYSFQEMASIDVPETLEYISGKTDNQRILVIGHSQGSTQFIAAMSDHQVSQKVQSYITGLVGLSPVPHISDVHERTQKIYDLLSYYVPFRNYLDLNYPVFSSKTRTWFKKSIKALCSLSVTVCEGIMWIPGLISESYCPLALGRLLEVLPGGSSFRSYAHFEQLSRIESDTPVLRKFDFGSAAENRRRYGTDHPPEYDYSLIKTPLLFHSGKLDTLVTENSLLRFAEHFEKLGGKIRLTLHEDWDHFSPLISTTSQIAFSQVLQEVREIQ